MTSPSWTPWIVNIFHLVLTSTLLLVLLISLNKLLIEVKHNRKSTHVKSVQLTKFLQMNTLITSIQDQETFSVYFFSQKWVYKFFKDNSLLLLSLLSARALTLILIKVFVVFPAYITVFWNVSSLEGLVYWFCWQGRTYFNICGHITNLEVGCSGNEWSWYNIILAMLHLYNIFCYFFSLVIAI